VLLPSKGPDVAVFIGLVAFKTDTAVHPVFDPGVKLEIVVESNGAYRLNKQSEVTLTDDNPFDDEDNDIAF
jgi:hypothetical protein